MHEGWATGCTVCFVAICPGDPQNGFIAQLELCDFRHFSVPFRYFPTVSDSFRQFPLIQEKAAFSNRFPTQGFSHAQFALKEGAVFVRSIGFSHASTPPTRISKGAEFPWAHQIENASEK
jgi:hypothetical protein